jgi:hypothetical protein
MAGQGTDRIGQGSGSVGQGRAGQTTVRAPVGQGNLRAGQCRAAAE